jgi:hypothetical protein
LIYDRLLEFDAAAKFDLYRYSRMRGMAASRTPSAMAFTLLQAAVSLFAATPKAIPECSARAFTQKVSSVTEPSLVSDSTIQIVLDIYPELLKEPLLPGPRDLANVARRALLQKQRH